MILGIDELHRLVAEKKLVEDLSERELNNPEGCGFDLRIGEVYELNGKGFLGISERETPKATLVAEYNPGKKDSFIFLPGKYYLIKTIEKINTPKNIAAVFFPRTTLFRSGLALLTSHDPPGYCGELTFGIVNLGTCEMEIEMGARICHVMFFEVTGSSNPYRGQWQGGRVSAESREHQV